MLGLKKGFVELQPHNEHWHRLFAEEKARLQQAIGERVVAVEHVGSTSICGISAKPVLDIAVAVEKFSDGEKCVRPLENLGYQYRGEHGIAGRHYFVKGEPRTHHLHMVELNSDFWRSQLIFRDCLLRNATVAGEYEKLKKDLARKHFQNREAYLAGKSEFIEKVLQDAGL
jgi:GrpB-like predicted nucleotidyltransferase (UPF0157 family)